MLRISQLSDCMAGNWPHSAYPTLKADRRLPHPPSTPQASSLSNCSPVLLSPPSPFFLGWEVAPALRQPILGHAGSPHARMLTPTCAPRGPQQGPQQAPQPPGLCPPHQLLTDPVRSFHSAWGGGEWEHLLELLRQ